MAADNETREEGKERSELQFVLELQAHPVTRPRNGTINKLKLINGRS